MLDVITRYLLIAVAILVPLLLLAGVVWVLINPLPLDDAEQRKRDDREQAQSDHLAENKEAAED